MRAELSKLESETSATHSKNDREIMNFQRECKTLKQVEADLVELKKTKGETEYTLTHQLQEAKLRYKDCLDMFKGAWQQLLDERAEAERQKELAEAAEKAANAPPSSRRKGKTSRKKSPKKGGGSKLSKKSPERAADDAASQRSEATKSQRSVLETASQKSGTEATTSQRSLSVRSTTSGEPQEQPDAPPPEASPEPRHEESAAPAPAQDAAAETPKKKKSKKASGSTKKSHRK